MIRTRSLSSGLDYLKLNWTHPTFLPERYELMYVCTMRAKSIPFLKMNNSIIINSQNLSSDTTSVYISDLHPISICTIFLLAVYNPASLDSGMWIIGRTLDEAKSKIKFSIIYVISDFIIILNC